MKGMKKSVSKMAKKINNGMPQKSSTKTGGSCGSQKHRY